MAVRRERFFECEYRSHELQRTTHLRAWDPESAEVDFRTMLFDEDVAAPGIICIRRDGTLLRQVPFRPAA